jgi:hypothetical protein
MTESLESAKSALYEKLEKTREPQDVYKRMLRIGYKRMEGNCLLFDLERHPRNWTSIQHYRFDIHSGKVKLISEEVVELKVTGDSLVEDDLSRFFGEGNMGYLFDECGTVEEVRKMAAEMVSGFMDSLEDQWSCPQGLANSPEEICHLWEKASIDALEKYPDAFVQEAIRVWEER